MWVSHRPVRLLGSYSASAVEMPRRPELVARCVARRVAAPKVVLGGEPLVRRGEDFDAAEDARAAEL
jgi:hypothetical protein